METRNKNNFANYSKGERRIGIAIGILLTMTIFGLLLIAHLLNK